jgi:hypothetical protein
VTEAAPPPVDGSGSGAPQNGLGTAALVMGILQFVCLGPIGSVLAIVFGRIGMTKAKRGEATNGSAAKAGFWLGIAGLVLMVVFGAITAVIVTQGVGALSASVDPARNAETGLPDGQYGIEPTTSTFLNDRCSFGGVPIDLATERSLDTSVTVVGSDSAQCGPSMDTPGYVIFTVVSGVAEIVEVG